MVNKEKATIYIQFQLINTYLNVGVMSVDASDILIFSFFYYRYDIIKRLLDYSILVKLHLKATSDKTLLQFYTEQNNLELRRGAALAPVSEHTITAI